MKYTLLFDEYFKKELRKLAKVEQKRILKKVFELEKFPEIGKHLVGINLWSLRVGKFRIIYEIENEKLLILVLSVGHRKNIYEDLKKLK